MMRTSLFTLVAAATFGAACANVAHAGITFQSSSRSVISAYQFPEFGDVESSSFNDLGLWVGGGPVFSPAGTVFATVSQGSNVHASVISFNGQTQAVAHPHQAAPWIFSAAESYMNVKFTLTQATPYEFTASWTTSGFGAWPLAGFPYIALTYGPDQDEIILVPIQMSTVGESLEDSIVVSGLLEPGEYELDASLFAHAASGMEWNNAFSEFLAQVEFELHFGCPNGPIGDLTGDCSVGVADLLILLSQWGRCADCTPGACPADLTGDCSVGVADLLILLANWG